MTLAGVEIMQFLHMKLRKNMLKSGRFPADFKNDFAGFISQNKKAPENHLEILLHYIVCWPHNLMTCNMHPSLNYTSMSLN